MVATSRTPFHVESVPPCRLQDRDLGRRELESLPVINCIRCAERTGRREAMTTNRHIQNLARLVRRANRRSLAFSQRGPLSHAKQPERGMQCPQ
jgi:hypothetical protein